MLATAPRPIRTVLVANRGEIACRIIRSCRLLGLRSVAVYSDADRESLHVRSADDAQHLGPAPAAASYLNFEAILRAVRTSGADAVHPGYGFLSENASFVRRCEEEGILFIGPSSAAVAAMGSKIEAKKIAEAAGVPTVPGYHGPEQTTERLAAEAARIGYPVLVKASAGGGGRGMRLVERPEDFASALSSAKSEARSAFGDDTVLLEKFVLNPRHLEVQLVGDSHGNLVHLFERDCSVQRNNQKVIEEAPAPNLPAEVRHKLLDRAVKLGKSIGYTSAGTVEFIMASGGSEPYFLEMNTRLQVEHPVTEAITGVDLVDWQLRIAAGLPAPLTQEQIKVQGHAIEVRLAAERPDAGFQPSVGRFEAVDGPPGLRFDTGVASGSDIGLHYDSMIAKLISHAPDRPSAVDKLRWGLDRLALLGPATNQAFLSDCLKQPEFAAGLATTGFLTRAFPSGWKPESRKVALVRAVAAARSVQCSPDDHAPVWQRRTGFRVMGSRRSAQVSVEVADEYGGASVRLAARAGRLRALVDGVEVDLSQLNGAGGLLDGYPVFTHVRGPQVLASVAGLAITAMVLPTAESSREGEALSEEGANSLTAPLPGIINYIGVKVGDRVEKGDTAVQIEAMKLVHTLAFSRSGVVSAVHCATGDTVTTGATLVEITSSEED